MNRRMILPGLLAALLLTVSACGSSNNDTKSNTRSDSGHNKADVAFAQEMIPHHEQAVEMAKLAATRAQSAEVKTLASNIAAAQGPEIETMNQWLKGWGEDSSMAGMGRGDMEMPGMMRGRYVPERAATPRGRGGLKALGVERGMIVGRSLARCRMRISPSLPSLDLQDPAQRTAGDEEVTDEET